MQTPNKVSWYYSALPKQPRAIALTNCTLQHLKMINFLYRGRMDPKHLEAMILRHKNEGRRPFFVNCTSGTTVMGAFDPINDIADICQEHNIWMHIDVSM